MASQHNKIIRYDLQIIADGIKPESKVLDLGCGNGELLSWLQVHKSVKGIGIEQDEEKVLHCISHGLSILQGNINDEVEDFADTSFDYVILSQTLQQVFEPVKLLKALARIGKKVIVSFPNFSHYSIRFKLLTSGLAPKSNQLPYSWYDTPNIRVITLADFRKFAKNTGYNIIKETAILTNTDNSQGRIIHTWRNLRANHGIFTIESTEH